MTSRRSIHPRSLLSSLLGAFILSLGVGSISAGCSGGVVQRVDDPKRLPPPPPRQGFLKLPSGPDDARIYIDGAFRGRLSDYPRGAMLLPIGMRRLKLTALGYAPIYAIVQISSNEPVTLGGALLSLTPSQLSPSSELSPE